MSDILLDVDGHVATITLNRPEKLNAVTPQHFAELVRLMAQLSSDVQIRVVVLTGAGRAFCAGGDVSILGQGGPHAGKPFDEARAIVRYGSQNAIEAIRNARPVTISAINGVCAGGGLALACATDLRYATDTAVFTSAFARVAQPGDMALGWSLTKIVGASRARELMFLSTTFDGRRAAEIGLVHEAVAAEDLRGRVAEVATTIASFAPLALAAMKANMNDADVLDLGPYLDIETDRYLANSEAADTTEGAKAFLEKRAPAYIGR